MQNLEIKKTTLLKYIEYLLQYKNCTVTIF